LRLAVILQANFADQIELGFQPVNVFFLVFEENRPIVDAIGVIPPENIVAMYEAGREYGEYPSAR